MKYALQEIEKSLMRLVLFVFFLECIVAGWWLGSPYIFFVSLFNICFWPWGELP